MNSINLVNPVIPLNSNVPSTPVNALKQVTPANKGYNPTLAVGELNPVIPIDGLHPITLVTPCSTLNWSQSKESKSLAAVQSMQVVQTSQNALPQPDLDRFNTTIATTPRQQTLMVGSQTQQSRALVVDAANHEVHQVVCEKRAFVLCGLETIKSRRRHCSKMVLHTRTRTRTRRVVMRRTLSNRRVRLQTACLTRPLLSIQHQQPGAQEPTQSPPQMNTVLSIMPSAVVDHPTE